MSHHAARAGSQRLTAPLNREICARCRYIDVVF
jgi:hypothetical protein